MRGLFNMNKTLIIVLGAAVVAGIIGLAFYATQNTPPAYTYNATPTSSAPADTSQQPAPDQTQQSAIPTATTDANASPTDTTVVLSGAVVPNGAFATYWYEYGTTPENLGSKTLGQVVGSGFISIPTPGYITGLVKDTTYYYRLVAVNQNGQIAGQAYTFKTSHGIPAPVGSIPTPKTLAATGISKTGATLNGEVTPNNGTTRYWFEYGKTTSLGNTVDFTSVGNGIAAVPASLVLTNLAPGTIYFFRLDAQNQFGTVISNVLNFKTGGTFIKN